MNGEGLVSRTRVMNAQVFGEVYSEWRWQEELDAITGESARVPVLTALNVSVVNFSPELIMTRHPVAITKLCIL